MWGCWAAAAAARTKAVLRCTGCASAVLPAGGLTWHDEVDMSPEVIQGLVLYAMAACTASSPPPAAAAAMALTLRFFLPPAAAAQARACSVAPTAAQDAQRPCSGCAMAMHAHAGALLRERRLQQAEPAVSTHAQSLAWTCALLKPSSHSPGSSRLSAHYIGRGIAAPPCLLRCSGRRGRCCCGGIAARRRCCLGLCSAMCRSA